MNATQDDTRILTNGNLCPITYDAIIEACQGEPFTMSLTGDEAKVATKAVNIGIDSRLQACFVPDRGDSYENGQRTIEATIESDHWEVGDTLVLANTLECVVSPESLPVLLRRLYEDMEYTGEDGDDADVGHSLASVILDCLGFDDCGQFVGRED